MNADLSILILAAGSSSRMGQSKQLLSVGGVPLIKHTVNAALGTGHDVMVVLGARHDEHRAVLQDLDITTLYNKDSEKGIGSSITSGVRHIIQTHPSTHNILIMVCDQVLVTTEYLRALIRLHDQSTPTPGITASKYADTIGVPAVFNTIHFEELLSLKGDVGAKKIIQAHRESVEVLDFPEGVIDLDTPEDYERYRREFGG